MRQILMICAACALLIGCGNPKGRAVSADASLEASSETPTHECSDAEKAMGEQENKFSHQSSDYGSQPEIRSAAVRMLEICKPRWEKIDEDNFRNDSDPEDVRVDGICRNFHVEEIKVLEEYLSNNQNEKSSLYQKIAIEDAKNCAFYMNIRVRRLAAEAKK